MSSVRLRSCMAVLTAFAGVISMPPASAATADTSWVRQRGYDSLFVLVLLLNIGAPAARAEPPTYLRSIEVGVPIAVSVGPQDEVFVLDINGQVVRFNADGQAIVSWDAVAGLPAGTSAFSVEVGDGLVFVSMGLLGYPFRIRIFDRFGVAHGEILDSRMESTFAPWGMAASPYGLFIADNSNALFRWDGQDLARIAEGSGCGPGEFWAPVGVAVTEAGELYVTEYSNRLGHYSLKGAFIAELGSTAGCGQIRSYPRFVAAGPQGNLVVSDGITEQVMIISASGEVLESWGGPGTASGQFRGVKDVATDRTGRIYVADLQNNRVQVFGAIPTRVMASTWGRLKSAYR